MRTKRTKGYIVETAKEFDVKPSQVEEVGESMFRFVAEVMKEGDRKGLNFAEVRLMGWGLFKVKEGRRKFFERLRNEKSTNTGK